MNILIIEDSPTQLEFIKTIALLAFPDANIIDILNLDKGLRVAETLTSKDVILLDLMFDESTPEQTIAKFTPIMKKLPVIIITAMENTQYGEKAKNAGANNYLQKPITQELLRVHILQAIQEEVIKVVSKITDKTVINIERTIIQAEEAKTVIPNM